ncbi:Auxin response factor like [Actinidia chinensis var. chinensis]|uniref:Auxin response factor n=1 Tax=Actinidia chinensis var. chinensis TaxID=1590841 RepID=A0A2R6R2F6_ACTCC|nr:Auxin response factor like [Actinidia chinensis var. chinensis]
MDTTAELRPVNLTVWKICAGAAVQIPAVDSRVYYFPQGHAEHSSSPPLLSPLVTSQPLILCRVAAVSFLANPKTDEVFAKIRLVPTNDRSREVHALHRKGDSGGYEGEEDGGDEVVTFSKILTPSDANNGGGFSVPKFCADSVFPPLDYAADPPVQNLLVMDVDGVVWEFRHIYRGTPRRHLLTTGWSKFVNHKKLVAGDSVVFCRNRNSGELFVGVRRAVRSSVDCGGRWNFPAGLVREEGGGGGGGKEGAVSMRLEEEGGGGGGKEGAGSMRVKVVDEGGGGDGGGRGGKEEFWGSGRVSAESVVEAAELAARGMEFEVLCYPKVGWADFVVKAETVEESLNVIWIAGMRVKMAMETEDRSKRTWFHGTVTLVLVPDVNCPWRGSPWRMLQVTWDEPENLQNVKRVSPWQVKYDVHTPLLHCPYPPAKKLRIPQNPELPTDGDGNGNGDGDFFFPIKDLSNSIMGQLKPSLMNYTSFPAGMQGARQDPFGVSSLSNFTSENTHNMTPKLETLYPELNIVSSQSENWSPDSQNSVHFFGNELTVKQGCNSTKVGLDTIRLFGKTIRTKHPVESHYDNGRTKYNGTEDNSGSVFDSLSAKTSRWA